MLIERENTDFNAVNQASEIVSEYWNKQDEREINEIIQRAYLQVYGDPRLRDFLLEGTGFDLVGQISVLKKELLFGVEPKQEFIQKVREDVVGFYMEYLARFPALPIYVDRQKRNGEERLVCSRYGNALWLNIISDKEREGSTLMGFTKLEQELLQLPPGSLAFVTSPSGWSGFTRHPVSQTYIFRVDDDYSIEALTIRSSMNLTHNVELIGLENDGNERDRIKQVVETVTVWGADNQKRYGFTDVGKKIHEIMNSKIILNDPDTQEQYSYKDLVRAIDKRKDLSIIDAQIEGIVKRFERYYDAYVDLEAGIDEETASELMVEIGRMVLDMSIAMGYSKGKISKELRYKDIKQKNGQYAQARSDTAELGGCAGGGIVGGKLKEGQKIDCCHCGACGAIMTAIVRGGYLVCSVCGAKKKI